ncbi:alpha/beta fold hydrolase [Pseudoduganella danionis]|uniref:alpha/beta fold hydrolase n=1 Tax=Pseudoduganella danionis TaxID=1890295 RepID=UPI0035AF0C2E
MSLFANAVAAPSNSAAFAKPHQLVDIGGRKINLYCTGQGATTVIFDGPAGDAGWTWFKVQPEVAKHTRACIYDRAGFGFSDPAQRPNTSENAVDDLHKALLIADIKPPFLLVGNSLGGSNVQVFTYRYPHEVKGLVLVEPQSEDETTRTNKASQGLINKIYAMVKDHDQQCLVAANKGIKPGSDAAASCIGEPSQYFGPLLGKQVKAMMLTKSYWKTRVDEANAFETSDKQLRTLRKPFGSIPLIVLTRGVSPYADPSQPQSAVNKAVENENEKIHKEIAALSTKGKQRVVAGASHGIQGDQPSAVTEAIVEVLGQIK